jgi:hypothetical protein
VHLGLEHADALLRRGLAPRNGPLQSHRIESGDLGALSRELCVERGVAPREHGDLPRKLPPAAERELRNLVGELRLLVGERGRIGRRARLGRRDLLSQQLVVVLQLAGPLAREGELGLQSQACERLVDCRHDVVAELGAQIVYRPARAAPADLQTDCRES